ncbi:chromatin remodeling complex subunit [Coccidioides immitis RS]|uniref:Chromatin remodeling complex subunit n=2 Tax=Coccidioides immitis TaxID=5501 RepID=A0A0E1RZW5_COCIM|nr:chromatin remodeling complex subunit [Coccidioides immitis RS]EAS35194.2 chromatin remodeling complex subunit [Coccidioides immitis RS]
MDSSDEELVSDLEDRTDDIAASVLSQFIAVNADQRRRERPPESENRLVCVSIPRVDNEHEFLLLPGHSRVDRIVSKANDDAYQIPYGDLLDLRDGPAALSLFKGTRSQRLKQSTLRAQEQGFVNIETLNLSSDEEQRPARRLRKRLHNALSVSPPQFSSSSEFDNDNPSSAPSIRRSRRLASQTWRHRSFSESQDESDELNGDVNFGKRRSQRARKEVRPAKQGVRTSQRLRTGGTRPMMERMEDDISEVEAAQSGSKYSGAREIFEVLPKDNLFRLRHQPACATCFYGDSPQDPLVYCQGCTSSYHKACLGPRGQRLHLATKVDSGYFILQCRACLGTAHAKDRLAPHLGSCSQCLKPGFFSKPLRPQLTARQEQLQREENGGIDPSVTVDVDQVNSVENMMFRCATCKRCWHMSHLPAKSRNAARVIFDSDDDREGDEDDLELQSRRFNEHSRRWECHDCDNAPGEIEVLVAWRPMDLNTYTPGYTSDMLSEVSKEYLVKWQKLSYFRATWMPGSWVWGVTAAAMRKAFHKSSRNLRPCMTTEDAIPEEFLHIDIVLDVRYSNVVSNRTREIDLARITEVKEVYAKYKGLTYEEAVWEQPPESHNVDQWRSFQDAYREWVQGNYVRPPNRGGLKKHLLNVRSKDFEQYWKKSSQPVILTGGQLMQYQLIGLNWIYESWFRQRNAILADEMGLGKTIQVIAFFAALIQDHNCWPFLVVVPNSTVPNWRSEIRRWAPSLRVVTYYGLSTARKLAHDYEMFPGAAGKADLRCHIVITSYETMADPHARRIFAAVPWQVLVVDEGHRLKNDKSQLYESLSKINFPFKLLLTGTPLQNNIRELFNIIQFCDPSKDAETLEAQYQNLTKENISELHKMILPYFQRRTKAQVLSFLPPMAQIIIPVSMTVVQKKLYKSILAKNPQLIKAIFKKTDGRSLKQSERHNLNNILVQLRKCLCHPFVYSKAIEERGVSDTLLYRNLVEASSKLQLLELLLPKLQERGHRVLLFSQFLDFLDIIEDFLDGLGVLHLRLDGSLSSLQKQKRIDEFNAPNSPYFVFMLSTRAGGVGINLATADTVIIMDPDFNPHQDIQALSRAHRIGQHRKVLVFQLMTKGTAEEKIIQIGRKKMALDQALIGFMDMEDDNGLDLESILRHGADALFDDDDQEDVQYDSESVEKLLERSEVENTKTGEDSSAESQFSFARVWTNDSANLEDRLDQTENSTPNSTVWEKILKERERIAKQEALEKAETLGRGKRKRQAVDYALPSSPFRKDGKDSDTEFTGTEADSDNDGIRSDSFASPERAKKRIVSPQNRDSALGRPYKRAQVPDLEATTGEAPLNGTSMTMNHERCIACDTIHPQGHCRLKQAGVEHCGLCGIAHFGHSRTCPHLNSEVQVASMLSSLKESTEQRALVEEATKYLRGIRGDLVRRKKHKPARAGAPAAPHNPTMNPNANHWNHPPTPPIPPVLAPPPRLAPVPGPGPAHWHQPYYPWPPAQGPLNPNHPPAYFPPR